MNTKNIIGLLIFICLSSMRSDAQTRQEHYEALIAYFNMVKELPKNSPDQVLIQPAKEEDEEKPIMVFTQKENEVSATISETIPVKECSGKTRRTKNKSSYRAIIKM